MWNYNLYKQLCRFEWTILSWEKLIAWGHWHDNWLMTLQIWVWCLRNILMFTRHFYKWLTEYSMWHFIISSVAIFYWTKELGWTMHWCMVDKMMMTMHIPQLAYSRWLDFIISTAVQLQSTTSNRNLMFGLYRTRWCWRDLFSSSLLDSLAL